FIGGSAGSLLGTTMWQQYGWTGVTLAGIVFQLCAFFFQYVVFREKTHQVS
ncbi:MFS transporter, partial [Bifidobacterium pseudocatenulatum]|nr:MFS transporter [Bifidobacterium pseudocatenulatum]